MAGEGKLGLQDNRICSELKAEEHVQNGNIRRG